VSLFACVCVCLCVVCLSLCLWRHRSPFTVFFCSIKNRANTQTSERPNDDRTMVDPVVAPDPPECMDAHWQASTYAQFCLDVPRLKLVVDGVHDAGLNPTCAYAWLVNLFPDEQAGLQFAYWCTQTALADVYARRLRDVQWHKGRVRNFSTTSSPSLHLLDDGPQNVEVQSYPGTLRLFKPFRVCQLDDEGTPRTLRRCHLHVTVFASPMGARTVNWEDVVEPVWRGATVMEQHVTSPASRLETTPPCGRGWVVVRAPDDA
jgi:hypothetical protein